jgi:hypothetical protein
VERVIKNSKRTNPLYVGSIKSNVSIDVKPQMLDTDSDQMRRSGISKVLQDSQV